jgi:hypothetical protein
MIIHHQLCRRFWKEEFLIHGSETIMFYPQNSMQNDGSFLIQANKQFDRKFTLIKIMVFTGEILGSIIQ